MLRAEENERLVRVGAGTPAGELFRRYWQPALLSEEVPEIDSAPVRVRLLGEDLVAFRDTEGQVGLVDAFCPHRRAPMFYGRNEECGLRCVYHGWKFDRHGDCTDLPSEPAGTPMLAKAKIKAYPTVERGGIVWTYMGPIEAKPPEPDFEWTRAPTTHRAVSKSHQGANYLQGLEGGLDTAHVSFLHNNKMGDKGNLFTRDNAPKIEVFETGYGYNYVSTRDLGVECSYVRFYQYILPFQQMRPNITQNGLSRNYIVPRYDGHIWVPIDDEQTFIYNWMVGSDETCQLDPDFVENLEVGYGRGADDYLPGTYKLKAGPENDYMIDRADQKTTSFTGIKGINTQDMALQEGMGAIVDRTKEYLGTSDTAIIAMRKILLEATHQVERGEVPPGTDPISHGGIRPHDGVVPKGDDWRTSFAEALAAKW